MDVLAACRGRHVYLDTNIFIYAVEGLAEHAPVLGGLFDLLAAGEVRGTTSELTLAEALAKPLENNRDDVARIYQEMLTSSGWLAVVPIDRLILVEAARLRAKSRLRLPDAIHVATAARAGCSLLLSNDRRLRVPEGMTLLALA